VAGSIGDSLSAVFQVELIKNVAKIGPNGALADEQLMGNIGIRQPPNSCNTGISLELSSDSSALWWNSVTNLAAMPGESITSPAAVRLTASTISVVVALFNR
jgi:hypothetical protein